MATYITSAEFLTLAGGADRFQEIADADSLETYLETVLGGAEARLNAGIERAGYPIPIDLSAVAEALHDGLRAMLGQYVAGFAAQAVGGPDHLMPLAKEAAAWLEALLKREASIPGVERPASTVTRYPRAMKIPTGGKNIPAEIFDRLGRIGGTQ